LPQKARRDPRNLFRADVAEHFAVVFDAGDQPLTALTNIEPHGMDPLRHPYVVQVRMTNMGKNKNGDSFGDMNGQNLGISWEYHGDIWRNIC
jgi:hypothetical protein